MFTKPLLNLIASILLKPGLYVLVVLKPLLELVARREHEFLEFRRLGRGIWKLVAASSYEDVRLIDRDLFFYGRA